MNVDEAISIYNKATANAVADHCLATERERKKYLEGLKTQKIHCGNFRGPDSPDLLRVGLQAVLDATV